MRGTLHLLPSSEYGLWQAGLSTYRHFLKPSWSKAFGLAQDELNRMIEAMASPRRPSLTREELAAEVARLTESPGLGAKMAGSWGSTLKPAAFRGSCASARTGRNVTFARPDQWMRMVDLDPDEAMHQLPPVPRHQRPRHQGGDRPLVGDHAGDGHPHRRASATRWPTWTSRAPRRGCWPPT